MVLVVVWIFVDFCVVVVIYGICWVLMVVVCVFFVVLICFLIVVFSLCEDFYVVGEENCCFI